MTLSPISSCDRAIAGPSDTLATVPLIVAEAIVIVPLSIVIMPPIPTVRVVVGPVVRRRIRVRFDDRDARETDPYRDGGMRFGGGTLSDSCNPESSS